MTLSGPASQILASAAVSTDWSSLPKTVRAMTLDLFADALGVIAGGSVHPSMKALMRQVEAPTGPSTLIGEMRGASLRDALLLNAATTTVLQRQDGYAHAKGHPASQIVPIVLAIAEKQNTTPAAMLNAMVAGYEVAARVGSAMGGVPSDLHDNGNWVTIGNAVAAAHLLSDGDIKVIATAIDGTSSLALSFDRFTTAAGATMHHLYPASATTHALAVAESAVAGLTAMPGRLEDFYGPKLGNNFAKDALTEGVSKGGWNTFEILNGYFKLHPSCAHLHGVNDAVQSLIEEHEIKESDVEKIEIDTFGEAMEIDTDTPNNDLAARFSAKATVAAAIRFGRLDDTGLMDLEALAPLMRKITARHDPSLDQHTPAGRPGRVTMTLSDNRVVTQEVIYPRGTAQTLATSEERRDKALSLLARHYGDEGATRIYASVLTLDTSETLDDLTSALRR